MEIFRGIHNFNATSDRGRSRKEVVLTPGWPTGEEEESEWWGGEISSIESAGGFKRFCGQG